MAHVIDADYSVQFLLPPSLEDLVPRDHPARFIRELVQNLDFKALNLVDSPVESGRPPYAKSLLLKAWIYGYFQNIRSSRKLERACREHLSLLWLLGMHQPDHNSLWRFWKANRLTIRQVFRQTVQLALKAGLVSLAVMAVDGTKIQAVASGRSGWTQKRMDELLKRLDKSLEEREAAIATDDSQQQGGDYRLPKSLSKPQALREAIQRGMAELAQTQRKHYHPVEPEAHRVKCGGQILFAYNAQAVADEKAGIIVAADVTNQETDRGQLTPMLQQAQEVVQTAPGSTPAALPEGTVPAPSTVAQIKGVADSGYGAGADLAAAQAAGLDVVTPVLEGKPSLGKPYHASRFVHDAQKDVCRCPQGQELVFERVKNRRDTPVRVYRCHCKDCPVRSLCTTDRQGRMIEIADHHPAVVAMRQKLATPEAQERLGERARIIEPRFAQVKVGQAFRRWTVRGLENVRAQWHWLCATANLKVIFGRWACGELKFG